MANYTTRYFAWSRCTVFCLGPVQTCASQQQKYGQMSCEHANQLENSYQYVIFDKNEAFFLGLGVLPLIFKQSMTSKILNQNLTVRLQMSAIITTVILIMTKFEIGAATCDIVFPPTGLANSSLRKTYEEIKLFAQKVIVWLLQWLF